MAPDMWGVAQTGLLVLLLIGVLRALFRLKIIEDRQTAELIRTAAMVDTVTGAAMKVTTQTSAIAERLAVVTEKAATQAAEDSAQRHKVLGADLSLVLQATHDLAEQLTKKIEQPVLASTIQDATHELSEELGKKIDVGTARADASYQAANHANEKIAALTELVSKQQEQQAAPVPPMTQLDEIQTVVEDTHEIVKEIPGATGGR